MTDNTMTDNIQWQIIQWQTIQWQIIQWQTLQWQTIQCPKRGKNNDLQTITLKTKDGATTIPLKNGGDRRRTNNIQWPKEQTTIYKTLHRKFYIEQY